METKQAGWEPELLDWVAACQSAYHIENTPGHRFGSLPGVLEANRADIVEYVRDLIASAGTETNAARDVLAERRRQIEVEGWTPEHDDEHGAGEMAAAAACYALNAAGCGCEVARNWPWDGSWWKPSTARRDLVKAAALILAEIERLDRAADDHQHP
ncbi:hypothetical protein ACFQ4M_15880 [Thauera mechernichensis]|uniref:Phage protein n=1 Tax=Thauera mechernichensis TaxID=82788 RepID=A0ABW3WIG5_9RHOO|nr:hypothetical protein [Thauera mechernichensis]MDG3063266.1 hypothetical protein [Thauera mechernichensis]